MTDINPGRTALRRHRLRTALPAHLTAFNGHLFFAANDGVNGPELWESDGTAAGTTMVTDINPGQYAASARRT